MLPTKSMIAIDIGSSAVKIVELTHGKYKKLKSLGFELLATNSVVDGEIKDINAVRNSIKTLLTKLRITPRGRRAAVAISGSNVLVKRTIIDEPAKAGEEAEQVFLEAQQAFQHDMSELNFRYIMLEDTVETGKKVVMMVGAKRSSADNYCQLVHELDMKVGLIDCDVLSLANMFDYNYPIANDVVILINIGASITQVLLMLNGSILYSREIYQGGGEYDSRLAHELELTLDAAESLKTSVANQEGAQNKNALQIISDVNETLVDEINKTISFYYQNEDPALLPPKPQQIFICGGGARTIGIDTALAAQFALPVSLVNPFRRINVQSPWVDVDYMLSNGQTYGVAVGLAIRQFRDTN